MANFSPYTTLTSRVVLLPVNDIDTDQIIPARFLKVTEKTGLGAHLFEDWRYLPDGTPNPDFILNKPENRGAQILITGSNFGCGSSREHAPWALIGAGFRAVISSSFADIFKNNCLKNGFLPVEVTPQNHQNLLDFYRSSPQKPLTIDLTNQILILPDEETIHFPMDGFSKTCLLQGKDELGYLLDMEGYIHSYENDKRRFVN